MSLINQILNSLEKRGVHTAPDRTLIRAVPQQVGYRRLAAKRLAMLAALVVVGALLWLLLGREYQSQIQTSSAPVSAVVAVSAAPGMAAEERDMPASKLSLELSFLPPEPPEKKPASTARRVTKPAVAAAAQVEPARGYKPTAEVVTTQQAGQALPMKQVSRTQQADSEYRKALLLQRQGHTAEALAGYEAALKLQAQHDTARMALAALLAESKRGADAERVLLEGLKLQPAHSGFSMALARVQVEQGDAGKALHTLEQNLPQASGKADYYAFYAALLQREGRHKDAAAHYRTAIQLSPNNGVWLMGYGISLQELQRVDEAKEAYRRALASQTLSPELAAFVQQKLAGF